MKKYILTIDEGTTSLRVALFDVKKQRIKRFVRAQTNLISPRSSWLEQNADDIWNKTLSCIRKIIKNVKASEIYGLGITNQRETVVAWDRTTGKPLYNAIIWKCRRTAKYCQQLKQSSFAKVIKNKTGLIVNSYFSATKIKWLLENVKEVKQALKEDNLCVGTIESYLVYRLTRCSVFVTDVTNASRTMLFNIHTLRWDEQLLKYFNIPISILAKPVANDKVVGFTNLFGKSIKIAGLMGDQQASLLGQGCFKMGDIKNTYGTGCFMLANIGQRPITSKNNLLTTIANRINGKTYFALEGSIFSGGSIINQALEDGIASSHKKLSRLAKKGKQENLHLVPAFDGLGAPYWIMNAKAKYINKNRYTTKADIAKAIYEAIALRNYDVFTAMNKDIKLNHTQLCVDGGLSRDKHLMQLQANLIQLPIAIINKESTCMGAIICTGLATKAFKSIYAINFKPKKVIEPKKTFYEVKPLINDWKKIMNQYLKENK